MIAQETNLLADRMPEICFMSACGNPNLKMDEEKNLEAYCMLLGRRMSSHVPGKKEELPPYLTEIRGAVLKLVTDPQTKKVDPEIFLPGPAGTMA